MAIAKNPVFFIAFKTPFYVAFSSTIFYPLKDSSTGRKHRVIVIGRVKKCVVMRVVSHCVKCIRELRTVKYRPKVLFPCFLRFSAQLS